MNTHVLDPHTDAELRSLDAASGVHTDPGRRDATLATILATPMPTSAAGAPAPAVTPPASVSPLGAARRRRRPRPLALAGVAAATVTGAAIVLPTITASPSFASWTAIPAEVAAADASRAAEACRDKTFSPFFRDELYEGATLSTRLAERRGGYIAVLLTGRGQQPQSPPELSVTCIVDHPVGGSDADVVGWAGSGGGGFAPPREREFYEGAMSTLDTGGLFSRGEPVSFVNGRLGAGVTKLTIHARGISVDASIKDGTYAAWWPGELFSDEDPGPSGEGGPVPELTYDVTYADGTVARDVDPTKPREH